MQRALLSVGLLKCVQTPYNCLFLTSAGLSEWEDDRVLAAALAASQQEYIDSLKKNARGAEAL